MGKHNIKEKKKRKENAPIETPTINWIQFIEEF